MTATPPDAPSRRKLLVQTALALVAAAVIAVLVALPAEQGIDLTGFGKLIGLTKLAGPQRPAAVAASPGAAAVSHASAAPFRTDELVIKLDGDGEIERKVWMEAGQTIVYSWTADNEVYADFHGETLDRPTPKVAEYRVTDPMKGDNPKAASGALTAPMTGFHGWYFLNLHEAPVTIRVKLAGDYELRPYPPPPLTAAAAPPGARLSGSRP
jgi:hypothetical protein